MLDSEESLSREDYDALEETVGRALRVLRARELSTGSEASILDTLEAVHELILRERSRLHAVAGRRG